MKKLLVSALCFVFALLTLTGCGNSSSPSATESTSVPEEQEAAEVLTVPDLAGTDVDSARTILAGKGLIPKVVEEESSEPEGTVLSTDPGPGETVKEDDSVMLYVSSGAAEETPAPSATPASAESKEQDSQPAAAATEAVTASSGENDWEKGIFTIDNVTCQALVDTPTTIEEKFNCTFDSKDLELVLNDNYYSWVTCYRSADGTYSTDYSSEADLVYFYFVNVSGSPTELRNCSLYEFHIESRAKANELTAPFDFGQGVTTGITESESVTLLGTPDDDYEYTGDVDDAYSLEHTWYISGDYWNGELKLGFNKAGTLFKIVYEYDG